jgi:predicted Fe-Mo cluster-binding NifX family protein
MESIMKIAVSSNDNKGLESTVSEHFGHCPFFTMVTVKENTIQKTEAVGNPFCQGHQPFEIPNFLKSQGIQVIITQGMGGRAINFFQENAIQPVTGCRGTVKDAVEAFLSGKFSQAAPCSESVAHHHG